MKYIFELNADTTYTAILRVTEFMQGRVSNITKIIKNISQKIDIT